MILKKQMLNRLSTLAWYIVAWAIATNCSFAQAQQTLRVLSYNVHHCRGLDEKIDIERIARIVESVSPDLVALQEIDHKTRRSGGTDQAAELGRLTKLHSKFFKAIDFEGGEYGQAILSRHPMQSVRVEMLPNLLGREQRIMGIAEIQLPAGTMRFCTLHLDHAHEKLRQQQIERVVSLLAVEQDRSTIVAGDFNARPDSQVIKHAMTEFTLASLNQPLFTFPAEKPTHQIDFIAFRPKQLLQTPSIRVLDEPLASDHRPIYAELVWQAN